MLSHLRLHRRAPSNPASPQHDRFPAPDPAAQHEHPQQTARDVSLRPDTRPRSPSASQLPPKLPPIARVASAGSEDLTSPLFDAAPDVPEAGQPPARPAYDDTSRAGFIGGVALQNYRRAADQLQIPDVPPAMPSQLTRSKPPPPPIDTGVATRPTMPSNKQAKASWFSAPGDLHVPVGNVAKRPGGPRLASDPAPVPVLESQKGRKGLPFLKNPVSSLLMRRKTPQAAVEPQPVPPSYDPRIRGTRFHDFSAPRPKKPVSISDTTTTRSGTASTVHESVDHGEFTKVISNDIALESRETNANLDHGPRRQESSPQEDAAPPVPPKDESSSSLRTSSSAASRTTQIAPLRNPATASVRTTASRQLSSSGRLSRGSVASAVPRHMKSTSSRFSFDMIGAAEQERVLEERHRQREQEKKTDDPGHGDARFDDFDEDFDYDAMMDDDGLEERIPGVNADYEDEEDLDAAMDPDNDQENFAGFVFQRSNPTSSLASPNTPAMLATPRDATGKVIGFAMTKDITPVLPSADSPLFPGPFQVPMSDDTSGLGIDEPDGNVTAPPAAVYRPSQPAIAADPELSPSVQHDDIYFDDGLADELDFENDGAPFDESIFDHNDTDQYGRPIPGAFAQAKEAMQEAMQAAQQQQQPGKRDSDVTSSTSGRSATVQSTGHTSLDAAPQQQQNPQEDDGPMALKPPPAEPMPSALAIPSQDLAYQAALAEAAQKAAASGKFRRDSSPDVLAGLADASLNDSDDLPDRGYVNDDYDDGDGFANDYEDDFDFDDDAIIAEANASALANDSDGFYGQEFGFYSAPLPTHPLYHSSHQLSSAITTHTPSSSSSFSSLNSTANGHTPHTTNGVLTTENLFHYANGGYFGPPTSQLARSTSGRAAAALREPNLTPITERSEYSNRNSVMSFTLPPAIGSSSSDLPRSASASGFVSSSTAVMGSSPTPGLAQLALIPDEVDCGSMSLAGLMKLRNKAWGGGGGGSQSQGSGLGSWSSSREGSPRSERAVPVGGYMSPGSGSGSGPGGGVGVGEYGYLPGHVRVNSGLSLWSCSEEVDDDEGVVPPPRPGSAGALGEGGSGNGYAAAGLYMGTTGAAGGVVAPLPQRPQSLFLPPQGQLPVLSPGQQQMVGNGGSACSPVLEGEEAEAEESASASSAALNANGLSLAPALPLVTSRVTGRLAQQQQPQDRAETVSEAENDGEQPARRTGPGHRKRGSADSISYVKDGEGSGDRWVLERRRTAESGEVEVLGREVVAGGRI